jgi:gamma-glutamyl:cysteine ligase YbdK (ATP-grasp superfamily)
MSETPLHPAFSACGIELEYMIVDAGSLAVRPIADELLHSVAGEYVNDVDRGRYGWSNELARHLVEIKNADPTLPLADLPQGFGAEVAEINRRLERCDARLMPTAMHPWMNPATDLELWPHDYAEVYRSYDRIFDCRRHGWANMQSMHVNLPFANDAEFARLHAAIRHVLPIIPALAASSPIADGRVRDYVDFRVECYRTHADRVPSMMGPVVPEPVASEAEYRERILAPIYREIAPHDPDEFMRDEWLNARGAIARFDRHAIEIRVIDTQECPRADIAIAFAVTAVVRACYEGRWSSLRAIPSAQLFDILDACARDADRAQIADRTYLDSFGIAEPVTAGELWSHLLVDTGLAGSQMPQALRTPLENVLAHGPLARRILEATGNDTSRTRLTAVYRELCDCLAGDRLFAPGR